LKPATTTINKSVWLGNIDFIGDDTAMQSFKNNRSLSGIQLFPLGKTFPEVIEF